ncbi:hypothetical protein [uncultured Desulfobacter sp.]|uniref:4Fe-4S binding protein n=1 Tax=uncultured Desulfobacter sp. TaxID=240139 RepID=UPI002AA8058C|nr:hypothetical protein [uncultured Desulfobacter sp.]
MSARPGKLYCNTLCPVGTLLGLISKYSMVKIHFDIGSCNSCGRCAQVCKSGSINVKTNSVETDRCVSYLNCFVAYPEQAMVFRPDFQPNSQSGRQSNYRKDTARNRRNSCLLWQPGALAWQPAVPMPPPKTLPVQTRPTTIPENKTSPLLPSGQRSRYISIRLAIT